MKNERGGFLLEVLGLVAIIGIMLFFVIDQISVWSSKRSKSNVVHNLTDVMIRNVIEIKTRPIEKMPVTGQCLYRQYDLQGKFLSESNGPIVDGKCNLVVSPSRIIVHWKIPKYKELTIQYSPADFLKLPKYSEALVRVDVEGRFTDSKGRSDLKPYSITLFRR